jgi:hypothetical protein
MENVTWKTVVDGRIILKFIFKKWIGGWAGLILLGYGPVAAVVNTAINFQFPIKTGNFWTS